MSVWIEHGVKGRSWNAHKYVSRNNGHYVYSQEDKKKYREAAEKVRERALESSKRVDKQLDKLLYGSVEYDYKKLGKPVSLSFLEKLIKEASDKTPKEQREMLIETDATEFLIRAYGRRDVGKGYKNLPRVTRR